METGMRAVMVMILEIARALSRSNHHSSADERLRLFVPVVIAEVSVRERESVCVREKDNQGERWREREGEQRQFECVDSEDALSLQVSFRKRAL